MAARGTGFRSSTEDAAKLVELPSLAKPVCIAGSIYAAFVAHALAWYHVSKRVAWGMEGRFIWETVDRELAFMSVIFLLTLSCGIPVYMRWKTNHIRALQGSVAAGSACICGTDLEHWMSWVEGTWGPDTQVGVAGYSIMFLVYSGVGTLLFILSNVAQSRPLPLTWCVILGCAVALEGTGVQVTIETIWRKTMYKKLKDEMYPLVLGPNSFYFAGRMVPSGIARSMIYQTAPGSGCVFIAEGTSLGTSFSISAPVGEEEANEALAYMGQHNWFYQVGNPPRADDGIELGDLGLQRGAQ